MTQTPNPLNDCTSPEYQALALDAICVAARHDTESYATGIDLEAVAYSGVDALVAGRPLSEVLDMVSSEHPFAGEMRAELAKVAAQLVYDGVIDPIVAITPLHPSAVPFALEILGHDVLLLCERGKFMSRNLDIDLEAETRSALYALVIGESPEDTPFYIDCRHPYDAKVLEALDIAAGEVAAVTALVAQHAGTIERYYKLVEEHPEMADIRPLAYALRDIYEGARPDRAIIQNYDWRRSSGWMDLMAG